MGYTHYFHFNSRCPADVFAKISNDIKKVVEYCNSLNPDEIRGWDGYGSPEFDDNSISFNGDADKGEDCETFLLEQDRTRKNFCKTNRNVYDTVVAASVLIAKYYFNDMTASCDDGKYGYDKAIRLLKKALGWDNVKISYNEDDDEGGNYGVHIDVKNH